MSSSVEADIQQQQPTGKETDTPIHEETQRIIQSIRDVIAPQAEVIRPFAEERVDGVENAEAVEDRYGSSHYWDASGMAPLNAASAVSLPSTSAPTPKTQCNVTYVTPLPGTISSAPSRPVPVVVRE